MKIISHIIYNGLNLPFFQLSKYGGARLSAGGKKVSPIAQVSSRLNESPMLKEVVIEPAKTLALKDLEPLPEEIYQEVVNFAKGNNR